MKKSLFYFFIMIFITILTTSVYGFDNTSLRLKSFGTELKWIVDDEYTDILQNPAAIDALTANWLLTNFSNQSGQLRHYFDYDNRAYQGSSGSYLIGGFHGFSSWKIGLIADYWQNERWNTRAYNMDTDFYYDYDFDWHRTDYNEGTWIREYNNGTPSNDDDYRVSEEKHGAEYIDNDSGLNLKLIVGMGNFGCSYYFKHTKSNAPLRSVYDPWGGQVFEEPFLSFASHTYDLTEVGLYTPQEAISAIQEETNDYSGDDFNHILTLGFCQDLNKTTKLDLVASGIYSIKKNNSESRKKKQVDFDPDDDNYSYEDRNQYSYLSLETFKADLSGPGFEFDTRLTRKMNDRFLMRLIGKFHYLPLTTDDYEATTSRQEGLTMLSGTGGYDLASEITTTGKMEENALNAMTGLGGIFTPVDPLLFGFALNCYYTLNERILDLESADDEAIGILKRGNKTYSKRLSLPFGVEYRLKEKYAFRLGVNSSFYSVKTEDRYTGTEDFESYSEDLDVIFTLFNSYNTTYYSYGFGSEISEKVHLDLTGITDLTDVSDLYVSLIFKY